MRYLVIRIDDERALSAVQVADREAEFTSPQDGVVVIEIDESGAGAEVRSDRGTVFLDPRTIDRYAASTTAAAVPYPLSESYVPTRSTFRSRVNASDVASLADDADIAGGPGAAALPINFVGEKQTASYLSMNAALGTEVWTNCHLRIFETYWEPLGWALDEWIDTISLAPFEDTVQGSSDASSDGARQSAAAANLLGSTRGEATSTGSVSEAFRTAMAAGVSTRGQSASLGGPAKGAAVASNPLLALAQGMIGSFQFGVERASTSLDSGLRADLRKDVVSRLEQATSEQRASNNRSLASQVNTWRESRRLRAIRNLSNGRSANLAVFSVVRQWLVSTVEVPSKPIILIKAHDLDKPFHQADVFAHHAVLADNLLDPGLTDALQHAAASYDPSSDQAPAHVETPAIPATRITGKLAINDPAEGRGSKVVVSVLFASDGGDQVFSQALDAPERATLAVDIEVSGEVRKLAGWRFEFVNPGLVWDSLASVTPFDFEVVGPDAPIKVALPGPIDLTPGSPKTFARGFTTPGSPPPAAAEPVAKELGHLLHHLNANGPYYRLLIDLLTDPITRFVRLSKQQPRPPMPVDMQPVGIAGAHLAFFARDHHTSAGDEAEPIKRVLSTPTGGTFVEVLEGDTQISVAAKTDGWPRVALEKDATLPWPAALELPPIADASPGTTGAAAEPPDAPVVVEAELHDKLADMMKVLETVKSTVEALTPAAPKPPAAEAAEESGGETPAA